jgi:hypothetical protein
LFLKGWDAAEEWYAHQDSVGSSECKQPTFGSPEHAVRI